MQARKGAAVLLSAMAAALTPPAPVLPSAWAQANLVVPDGPRSGDLWDADLTAYLREPLDFLGPDSTENEIAVRKSAQTGFTTLLLAAIGHSIDRDPCRMMIIQPTDAALSDFNREKLQPAIDSSRILKKRVATQISHSAKGSTSYSKRFPGGSLTLAISTSAADLRSKTVKKLFRDEIDQYPDDLDGQGDPIEISDARLTSFLASGDWRKADVSTPTIKGASKIDRRFAAGDQRFWHVRCPGCFEKDGTEFVFAFGPNFRFERGFPHKSHYVTSCCGTIIEAHEKNALVRAGRWIATAARPGAFPSYHFDTLSSPFVPWDEVAKAFLSAGDDPAKLKTFWNLWLGLAFEIRGDAPDHVRLLERREEGLVRGRVPPRGLILTAAADVQMRGIWLEIVAMAPNRESWTVEALYLDGDTSDPNGEVFEQLRRATIEKEFPDAFGRLRRLDALAIDSGYRSHVVYSWVRNNQRPHPDTGRDLVLAVKGEDGWGRPAIGQPKLVDIDLAGKKVKQGAKVWAIGTWPLKGGFYADLRKEGVSSGRPEDPEGFCHFGTWLDEVYFRQITAEYLGEDRVRGKLLRRWKERSSQVDNHFLDCRVYNLALAEYLGLSSTTPEEWASLARARGLPVELSKVDLFTPVHLRLEVPEAAPTGTAVAEGQLLPAPSPRNPEAWIAPRADWMRR